MNNIIKYMMIVSLTLLIQSSIAKTVVKSSRYYDDIEQEDIMKNNNSSDFSVYIGPTIVKYRHEAMDDTDVKDGAGASARIVYCLKSVPACIDARFHYASYEFEHNDYDGVMNGGSLQFLYNVSQNDNCSIYIGGGLVYDSWEVDYVFFKYDDDGVSFVGRCGADFVQDKVYGKLELSYVGDIYSESKYEDETSQVEFLGKLGYMVSDKIGIEFSYDYYSKWKEHWMSAGISFHF